MECLQEYLNDFKLSIHNFTFHMAIILPLLSNKQLWTLKKKKFKSNY